MVTRRWILLGWLVLVSGCTNTRTEVIVITWTNLSVPSAVDQMRVEATNPRGDTRVADADLRDRPPPRSVGLTPVEGGALGPYEVRAQALRGGVVVVERVATFDFVAGQTRVLRLDLLQSCTGVMCGDGETCAAEGCRSVDANGDLEELGGPDPPRDGGPPGDDAGSGTDSGPEPPDGCVPVMETCDGMDEDCDGVPDNGLDLMTDPENCGMCGNACAGACVGGTCEACPAGLDDCDGDPGNGCETDLMTNADHCGMCDLRCRGMLNMCCVGSCC